MHRIRPVQWHYAKFLIPASLFSKVSALSPVDHLSAQQCLRCEVHWKQVQVLHIHPGDYDIDLLSADELRQAMDGKRGFYVLKLDGMGVARLNSCRRDHEFEAVTVEILIR